MDHEAIKLLLPLAAIDWLAPDEAAIVDEHLRAGCDECATELQAYREAASALALVDEPLGEHERIWNSLAARLVEAESLADRDFHQESIHGDESIRLSRRRVGFWRIAAGFAAAAALILALYAGFQTDRLHRSETAAQDRINSLEATIAGLRENLGAVRTRLVILEQQLETRERLQRILLTPDLSLTRLGPLAAAPQASAIVAVSRSHQTAVIAARGLPPAPAGKIYELWWITKESGPYPAGLFSARNPAEVSTNVTPPPSGQHVLASAVTLEPVPGLPKPTGPMYLKGSPG